MHAARDRARELRRSAGRCRGGIRPAAAGRDGSRGRVPPRARSRTCGAGNPGAPRIPGGRHRLRSPGGSTIPRASRRSSARCVPGSSAICRHCDRLVRRQDRRSRCGCEWPDADPDICTAGAWEPRRHVPVVERRARRHCHIARGVAVATECSRGRGEHRRGREGRHGIVTSCVVVQWDRSGVDHRPRDRRAQRLE